MLGCYFSLAAWTALGASELVAAGTRFAERRFPLAARHQLAFGTAGAVIVAALVIAPVAAGSRAVAGRERASLSRIGTRAPCSPSSRDTRSSSASMPS